MKKLSADELAELRQMIAGLGIAPDKQDDYICILDNIAISWADQSHGRSSVQLTLSARANYSFAGVDACVKVRKSKRFERLGLENEDAFNTEIPKGPPAP